MATEGFKARQQQRDFLADSVRLLSNEALTKRYQGLTELANPAIQSLLTQSGLIGQTQAGGVRANLARGGFGGTFAEDLATGFQTGAAYQAQELRARILQDLVQQSIGVQQGLSQGFVQASTNVPMQQKPQDWISRSGEFLDSAGKATAAAGALMVAL